MADDMLAYLREIQETHRGNRQMSFGEWSKDMEMRKASGRISPGVGMMGHLNTSSRAPTGPMGRPSGEQGVGWNGTPQFGIPSGTEMPRGGSQYTSARPNQPAPWIQDVDMQSVWYSPFEPVWPFGPPYYTRPREWNYPVGYNLNYIPERMALNGMLRGMRRSWGVLSTVESTRMDQLLRIPWTIQQKDKPRASSVAVKHMQKFFKRPDGKLSYGQWSRKLLFDSFDLDFPILYMDREGINGNVKHVEVLDGGTIFPLIDDAGRRPDTEYETDADGIVYLRRQPAYQQIIYGLPMNNYSEDEIINPIIRVQPDMPMFGYSPVEQCLTEITEAIRKTFYQLEFWRSGSMPELIVTVPDKWTPRQIAMFQGHFDALLSGQLTLKSKVRFVPGGMKPFDIKNASGESLWSQRDELLVRLACYAFSVSPTPFVRQMNRGTAQNAQQQAQEEGLYPLMSWFKDDIMDRIIQEVFGYEDIEFVYLPRPEVDLLKQSQIHEIQVRNGIRSRNEVREELGEEPIEDGEIYTINNSTGAVPLDMVVEGQTLAPGTPAIGGKPQATGKPQKPPGEGNPQRGPARPSITTGPTPVHKLGEEFVRLLQKGAFNDEINAAAAEATKPTHGQKDAGNYKKGHVWVQGLDITIETPKGKKRHGHEPNGDPWSSRMAGNYGYIRGTIGADGEQIDVCIGKHPKSPLVFVIDQVIPEKNDKFDEHKVMLGYRKAKSAIRDYFDSNGDGKGPERLGHITALSMREFKDWLKSGNHHKPISGQNFGSLVKADTISSATGLSWYDQNLPVLRRKKRKAKKLKSGPKWLQLAGHA